MMTARRDRGQITNAAGVAEMIGGYADSWFYAHRKRLEAEGLPKKDKALGGWHRPAVQAWLDRRAGIAPQSQPRPWQGAIQRAFSGNQAG